MTVRATIQIHFDSGDVSHRHTLSYSTLEFSDAAGRVSVFFRTPAEIDEVTAELAALRADMAGDAVITDSERDCGEQNPDTAFWCHKKGAHKTHRDTNGETWATAEAAQAVAS